MQSDHKSFQHIFGETHSVPYLASARLQRCTLTLGANPESVTKRLLLSESPPNVPPLAGETIMLLKLQSSHILLLDKSRSGLNEILSYQE